MRAWGVRVLLILGAPLALVGAGAPTASAQSPSDHVAERVRVPFDVGELLEFDVRFGVLRVGRGSMSIRQVDTVRGREAWHAVFSVHGGTLFFRVADQFESWMDRHTLNSLRFHQDLREGGRERARRFEIYPEEASFREDDAAPQRSVAEPLDDASFLYFVRTLPLEVGRTHELHRYFRPDRNPVTIRVLRRERVTVPAGTFDAIVIQPLIKTPGIFSENGRAEVWLSDDERRIVLQMKSQLKFGTLNLYLRSYRPGTPTPAPATPVARRD